MDIDEEWKALHVLWKLSGIEDIPEKLDESWDEIKELLVKEGILGDISVSLDRIQGRTVNIITSNQRYTVIGSWIDNTMVRVNTGMMVKK